MLDMNFVRENPDAVKEALAKRHSKIDLDAFLELDKQRREVILSVEKLKSQRNSASQEIGRMKRPVKMLTRKWQQCAPLAKKLPQAMQN